MLILFFFQSVISVSDNKDESDKTIIIQSKKEIFMKTIVELPILR